MVSLKAVQNIHRKIMYHDECDIYTYAEEKDEDGATLTTKSLTPLYLKVPCKVSFSLRTWDNFTHQPIDTTPYAKQPKIFLDTKYICEPGYYFEVRRYDQDTKQLIATYKGQGGKSQVSLTHQEILIDLKGDC